jgi:predicted transcriptional regulator
MPRHKGLGSLEQQVWEFLLERGPATGAVVRDAVEAGALSDSTIRTVLRRLEVKQYVRRQTQDGQFVYSSIRGPGKVAAEAVHGIVQRFCRGSLEELLIGLVDHRIVDGDELERLAARVAKAKRAEAKKGKKS